MSSREKSIRREYSAVYSQFDSSLIQKVRSEAFEEDIGQHSWIVAKDLREYLDWFALSTTDHVLDFGCGPAGPLTYVVSQAGVKATGVDINATALASARNRVSMMGLSERIALQDVSEEATLPFEDNCFNAVISIDVMMHLPDRARSFSELWASARSGRLLFFLLMPASSTVLCRTRISGYAATTASVTLSPMASMNLRSCPQVLNLRKKTAQ